MKKILSIILSIVLLAGGLFLLTGCEKKENTDAPAENNQVEVNNETSEHLWDNPEYSEYTGGVHKPSFNCDVVGDITVLGMKCKALNVTETDIDEWRQDLLSNGFTIAWEEGDGSWEVSSSTHTVLYTAMNYYFYIEAK